MDEFQSARKKVLPKGIKRIWGDNGNNVINGYTIDPGYQYIIAGEGGNDIIVGGNFNDTLRGGGGNDDLYGGKGDDMIAGDIGNDTLSGEAGNDTLLGGCGNDFLYEYAGNNQLNGGSGNDRIVLFGGTNIAWGDFGDDTFVLTGKELGLDYQGGAQSSTLNGGAGFDTYRFEPTLSPRSGYLTGNPIGTFVINDYFREAKWGTIDLTALNLQVVSVYGQARGTNDPNRYDLSIIKQGNDVLLHVQYSKNAEMNIYLKNAGGCDVEKMLQL